MPSEHRRRKDDTWTPDELNKALKVPKDEMLRKKRDDGDSKRHRDEVNGSDRRRHRDEADKKSRSKHRDRGDSPNLLTEKEERERQRIERRAKRDGGKEEKRSKPKEIKSSKTVVDDDDRRRKHHENDDDRRKRHKDRDEDKQRRHKDEERERRHHERDNRQKEESKRHRENDDDRHKRHKDESSRRHHEDSDRRRRHDDGDHVDQHDDRRERRHKEESSHRRHRDDVEESEEDRERRRQERRERKEKEKQRDDRDRHERKKDERKDRHDRKEREEGRTRHRDREEERGRHEENESAEMRPKSSRHRAKEVSVSSNGHHKVEEEPEETEDYNYDEDFEDYDDDFENDDDEMKELGRGTPNKEGEMEEVLRALDEENNRLTSAGRRSNWSDSTELSDERFKDNREETETPPKMVERQKTTFINFVSAKQRVMNSTVASKARKRFDDLSKLIELDVSHYDMFDLPPVKEYEVYIRSFGRSDTKQAYVQTHDDDIDRDVQTEDIESLSKWTQNPPENEIAVGGEGISVMSSAALDTEAKKTDPVKLGQFLERAGQYLFAILDEETKSSYEEERRKDGRSTASFSDNVSQLGQPNFLTGRQVTSCCFCQSDPNSLLTVHSTEAKDKPGPLIGRLSVVCVWNLSQPTYPHRICVSEMQVTCGCFSPLKANLVFAGMADGSVVLWDLRESANQHRHLQLEGEEHLVRFPTYNTAGIQEADNHLTPVVSLSPVHSSIVGSLRDQSTTESSSGLSFQVASLDERAKINLWVVAEISSNDLAGSINDLGLSPGGKMKMMRSSVIVLNNPLKYLSNSTDLMAKNLLLNPSDLNHLYVGTDAGCVVHGVRFGARAFPPSYSSLIDSPVPVVSMDFSPFGQQYFLVGCIDGSLHLYHTKIEHPIASWRDFISGESILSVRWSRSRPAVFFVLDNNSTVFTFDLVENGLAPLQTDRITSADATSLEISGDPNLLTPGSTRPAYMALALDSGVVEIMTFSQPMKKQQPLEEEFLASYVDRY